MLLRTLSYFISIKSSLSNRELIDVLECEG